METSINYLTQNGALLAPDFQVIGSTEKQKHIRSFLLPQELEVDDLETITEPPDLFPSSTKDLYE